MNKNDAIGVFDSGIGGLTAVKELSRLLPNENIIYLGDTARVPYGTRGKDTIIRYASEDMAFLRCCNVKLMIAACGTVSSVAGELIEDCDIPATGVILPAVKCAVESTKNGRIGIIGTSATVKSGSYERLIKELMPSASVYAKACPMFVPLVENGYIGIDCEPTKIIAREYLEPLKAAGIDTLILGCTHYPLLTDIIAQIMGEGCRLISSGGEAGKYAKKLLEEKGLLSDSDEKGTITLCCTDSEELFKQNAKNFLEDIDNITVKTVKL